MSSHSNITLPTSPPPLPPCPRHPVPLTLPRTSPGNIWGSSPFPRSHPHLAPRLPLSAHPFPSSPACPSLRNLAWPPHPRRVKASSLLRLFPPPFPTPQEPQIFAAPSQRLCEGCCFRQDCAHLLQVIPQRTGGTITSSVCAWKNTAFGNTFAAPDRQRGPLPLVHLPGHKTPPPRRPTKAWRAPELVRDPPRIPPAPGEGGQGTAGHCHVPTGRASLAKQGQESRGSLQGQRALPSHPPHAAFSGALPREEVRMPRAPQRCRKRLVSPTAGPTLAPAWQWGPRGERNRGAGPFPGTVLAASPRHGEQPRRRGSSTAEHLSAALLSSRGRHCAGRGGVWSTWLLQPLRISDASPDRAAIPPPKRGVLLSPQSGSGRGGSCVPHQRAEGERGGRRAGWRDGGGNNGERR